MENIFSKLIMALVLLTFAYLFHSLSRPLTAQQIDRKIKECQKYNLDYKVFTNILTGERGIYDINCVTKSNNTPKNTAKTSK